MPIQIRPISDKEAIEGLDEIFKDVQDNFHDQWDWMNASFYLEVLRCTIEDLRNPEPAPDQVARLQSRVAVLEDLLRASLAFIDGPLELRLAFVPKIRAALAPAPLTEGQ